MLTTLSRRRFIGITGAAAGLGLVPLGPERGRKPTWSPGAARPWEPSPAYRSTITTASPPSAWSTRPVGGPPPGAGVQPLPGRLGPGVSQPSWRLVGPRPIS